MDDKGRDFWDTFIIIFVSSKINDSFAGRLDRLGGVISEGAGGNWFGGKRRFQKGGGVGILQNVFRKNRKIQSGSKVRIGGRKLKDNRAGGVLENFNPVKNGGES